MQTYTDVCWRVTVTRDEHQPQGNSIATTDLSALCLWAKTSFSKSFDKVMTMLPTTYDFGKSGYTNVSKGQITTAIDTFTDADASDACIGQLSTLSSDTERKVLILDYRVCRRRSRNGDLRGGHKDSSSVSKTSNISPGFLAAASHSTLD